jgi:hypothetical protein
MKNERRINNALEATVNRGLASTFLVGVHDGVKLMKENLVPLHVSTRVVLEPNMRRSTDWKH